MTAKKIIVIEPDKQKEGGEKLDKLFGSKTRAKLLRLFFTEPNKTYYIRELSDTIKEQVNSIRRELDNMKSIGMVMEHNVSNKIYYGLDKKFDHYNDFIQLFSKRTYKKVEHLPSLEQSAEVWEKLLLPVRPMISALLIMKRRRPDGLDIFIVGDDIGDRISRWAKDLERKLEREINYAIMPATDFEYRLSMRDRFLLSVLSGGYTTVIDDYDLVKSSSHRA
ncbi:hypothetical protein FWH09_00650 [Candidatus Saccharibacteria bacterium]|nr:hypothetical protein [Candidatus Saccharibacteria bacterium]